MQTKEEYYQSCLRNRELVKNPDLLKCNCPKNLCQWHGKCKECIALHRYYNDHLPACLHSIVKAKSFEKILDLIELDTTEREKRPDEYYDYVREMDKQNKY